jgi:4-amino-4-deoxy-L-arabinose transferase-like glycosyltransferase
VAGASLLYLGLVAWVVALRWTYPYELEFVEGAVLDQVARVRHGLPLYAPPSLDYVALNYTPLYFWVCALASRALGEGFLALRAVSVLASAAACALLWRLVRHETGRGAPAWLAVGLFAATYRLGGAWLDVARADPLHLALLLGAVVIARSDRSPWRMPLAAGALLALAFLAKQSALVAAGPFALAVVVRDPRRGLVLAAAWGVLVAGAVATLNLASAGWFRYYAFTVPGFHHPETALALAFPLHDLVRPFWPALALGVLALARRGAGRPGERALALGALAVGFVGLAAMLRAYRGGYDNGLMTAHAAIAVLVALAFARLTGGATARGRARLERLVACVLVVVQLALLRWDPARQVPTPADRLAGDEVVAALAANAGRVLVPTHPYLARRAGRAGSAHVMPLMDVIRDGHGPRERALLATLDDSLRAHAWPTIVLDNRDWLIEGVTRAGYRPMGRVFRDPAVFWPVTGMRTRPEWVMRVPADSAVAGR